MPVYEYECRECKKTFSLRLHIDERAKKKPKCPHCGSRKLTQRFTAFFAKTAKKS